MADDRKNVYVELSKVDESLGLIFGFGIVSTVDGEPLIDLQGEWIPPEEMLKASVEFMLAKREMRVQHTDDKAGDVIFAWPLTNETAKAFGITNSQEGLMLAVRPHDPEILKQAAQGKFSGFSVGGLCAREEM